MLTNPRIVFNSVQLSSGGRGHQSVVSRAGGHRLIIIVRGAQSSDTLPDMFAGTRPLR